MEHMTRYSGQKLGGLLAAQGRKRRWLAAQVGISESSISRIISGKQTASSDLAERVSRTLQVPLFLAFDVLTGPEIGQESNNRKAAA